MATGDDISTVAFLYPHYTIQRKRPSFQYANAPVFSSGTDKEPLSLSL
jgi:hypothetical protein